jgi:hypothetical protein
MDSRNEEQFYKNLVEMIRNINEGICMKENENRIEMNDY